MEKKKNLKAALYYMLIYNKHNYQAQRIKTNQIITFHACCSVACKLVKA